MAIDRHDLRRRIIEMIVATGADINDAHAVILSLAVESCDRLLAEAAAVGALAPVQAELRQQIETIGFFVLSWRPGSPADGAALLRPSSGVIN